MKKGFMKKWIPAFAVAFFATATAGGIGLLHASADDPAQTPTTEDFRVRGASIRVVNEQYGPAVRFHVEMTKEQYERTYAVASEGVQTGTLVLPESKLSGDLTTETAEVCNIVTKNDTKNVWFENEQGKMESIAYIAEIPDTDYSTELAVVGYVTTESGTTYTALVDDISLAWVAYAEYTSENPVIEDETMRASLMSDYATFDVSFDGGTAEKVQYGSKLTAPTLEETAGKRFLGWFNQAGTNEWDFDSYTVKSPVNLYAKYMTIKTPTLEKGVLSWEGTASSYTVTVGEGDPVTVNGTSYALADAILAENANASGDYEVSLNAVGANGDVEYNNVTLKIAQLTKSNFLETLTTNGAQKNTYFVLTEDVSLTTTYDSSKTTTANGSYAENTVFAPVDEFKGALNGRGYRISVAYDGTSIANNTWEVFGGLFGYTESAMIENVNFSIIVDMRGHVHTNFASGAMISVLGKDTTIQNCYVKSVFNTWNDSAVTGTIVDGIGALAGKAFSASKGCVIKNNVVESSIIVSTNTNGYVQYEQKNSPRALVANVSVNIGINDNAYIVNRELPAVSAMTSGATYYEAFVAWGQAIGNNWLFGSYEDFETGKAGLVSSYSSWASTWTKETPSDKLWETEAWNGTTFGYDTTYGPTLCGKSIDGAIRLTNSNFLNKMQEKGAEGNVSFVLTENISLTTSYDASKRTTANGKYEEAIVFAPIDVFKGALDGRGYKISVEYSGRGIANGTAETFGGLFGYTESAVIKNVNFHLQAEIRGYVKPNCAAGAMIAVLGANTTVKNCFIESVIVAGDSSLSAIYKGIGAIAGKSFDSSSDCVITNNVASAKILVGETQQVGPMRLIGSIGKVTEMNANVYVINQTLPTEIVGDGEYDAFMAWGQDSSDNWLFASLADFVSGGAGHSCAYRGWSGTWKYNVTPSDKLWKTKAWGCTTFGYDETSGLTLYGKAVA